MIKKSRLPRIVVICLTSFVTVIVAALLVLTSSIGENLIRSWLEDTLAEKIGLPVSIGRFETNLWSRIQVDNLTIGANRGPDTSDRTLVSVDHISTQYAIYQLLWGRPALKAVAVHDVTLNVSLDSLGKTGVPLLDQPSSDTTKSDGSSFAFRIDTVSISGVNARFVDSRSKISISVSQSTLSAGWHEGGSYSGLLKLDSIAAFVSEIPLIGEDVEIAAMLRNEIIHIRRATARIADLDMSAEAIVDLSGERKMTASAKVDGDLSPLIAAVSSAYEIPPMTGGKLSAKAEVAGNLGEISARLDAGIENFRVRSASIPSIVIRAQYADNAIQIDTVELATLGGLIAGSGSTELVSNGNVAMRFWLRGIEASSVWKTVYDRPSPFSGSIRGRIRAEGRGYNPEDWEIDADLSASRLRYANRSIPDLKFNALWKQNEVRCKVKHGVNEIRATVDVEDDSLDGVFYATIPDIAAVARIADESNLTGSLGAEGTISGDFTHPVVISQVTGAGIRYRGLPVDTITAALALEHRNLSLNELQFSGHQDEITSSDSLFGLDSLTGSFEYNCELQGSFQHLTGRLSAHVDNPGYREYSADSASLAVALDGSRIELTNLQVYRNRLAVGVSAYFDTTDSGGTFDILLTPLVDPADNSDFLTPFRDDWKGHPGSVSGSYALRSGGGVTAEITGKKIWLGIIGILTGDTTISGGDVDFDMDIEGSLSSPNVLLSAVGRSIELSGYRVDSVLTSIRLADRSLGVDNLIVYTRGNTLTVSGRLEPDSSKKQFTLFNENSRVEARLAADNLDLSVFRAILPPPMDIAGLVSTDVMVSGTLSFPRAAGSLTLSSGKLRLNKNTSSLDSIELKLIFEDSTVVVDSATCLASGVRLSASGSATATSLSSIATNLSLIIGRLGRLSIDGTASNKNLNIRLVSDSLNLAVLEAAVPAIDSLKGRLSCDVSLSGEPSAPLIDGFLQLDELSFRLPKQQVNLTDGYANARFDRNTVSIDTARAILNGGAVGFAGSVTHEGGELLDISMDLQASDLSFNRPGVFLIEIDSATLSYGKKENNYVLDGDIVLGEVRLKAGIRPTAILPWAQSVESVDLELPELIGRTRLDVRIRESDRLWVDNNIARIRLRAELNAIGTVQRPNITGLLKVEEGYLMYLDRRFQIDQGAAFFSDPTRFNPEINLNARTQVTVYRRTSPENYDIYIRAEGLLDQLRYGLESEPPLDKPDIVALLTLGATRAELTGSGSDEGQGGLREVLADRVSMLTSERVSGYLSRRAESLFGFDEFTIEGNLFEFDNSGGPELSVSKRLSRKFRLEYSTAVGHLNDQTVRLGYHLTSRFSLQGETDQQGHAGIDLKYGIKFK